MAFSKYQGAGNDFILLDNLSGQYDFLTENHVTKLCDRRFGIGADGLILINSSEKSDFVVDYFNADGTKSFCGNGARCSVEFVAKELKLYNKTIYEFDAIDGSHTGEILNSGVKIEMKDVTSIETLRELSFVLNTGSPHYIQFDQSIDEKNVIELGRAIRNSDLYKKEGINVNWVEVLGESQLAIRTYERGVEDETLACGTGVTAAALAYHHKFTPDLKQCEINVAAQGGDLKVEFKFDEKLGYHSIFLAGPAEFVFKGNVYVG
ncbi:MAG: diaminopimelate epimerase [Bacteroidetes bacterium]|nr:diaminopimelate epimerase [Bacteroidota bacterium]